ncbi:hypothetical protein CL616_04585 [archaeon]|nr:hypothetical protein [archaeon]
MNIPLVLAARNTLGDILLGTSASDELLLRFIYFALIFTIFFKLSIRQLFKESNERKFALIISLAFGLIVMWFTPTVLLNAFKSIILIFGPFVLIYFMMGLVIKDKKHTDGSKRFNVGRLIAAVLVTGLLFVLISGTPGFTSGVGSPSLGFAIDEGMQDIKNLLLYDLSPLLTLIIIGAVVFGVIMLFRNVFKGKGAKGEGGKGFGWGRWGLILLATIVGMWLIMTLARGVGGSLSIPVPGGNLFFWILVGAASILVLYLIGKFSLWVPAGKAFVFGWNNFWKGMRNVWPYFKKGVGWIFKGLGGVGKWIFLTAIPAIWRGYVGMMTWIRGGRKLYIDIKPRPWKHFVSNVLTGIVNKLGVNMPSFFKLGEAVPFELRVRKALLWGRGRYSVKSADVKVNVNVGRLIPGSGATVGSDKAFEDRVVNGKLGWVYEAPNTVGPLNVNVIVSAPNSVTRGKTFRYNIGGAGSRRLPIVKISPRVPGTKVWHKTVQAGDPLELFVRVDNPTFSLGGSLPKDGNGIKLKLSGVPSGLVTPDTSTGPALTSKFIKTFRFEPTDAEANQTFTIKVEAEHDQFVGTAEGFVSVDVTEAPKGDMRVIVTYMPSVTPSNVPSIFNVVVRDYVTGAGVDGARVKFEKDGDSAFEQSTDAAGIVGSIPFAPPVGAAAGSTFKVKISAKHSKYRDVREGSVHVQVIAVGSAPRGVAFKVLR